MNGRTRTIASFFSVAMAAILVGTLATTQIKNPSPALAKGPEPSTELQTARPAGAPVTLDTFRDIAKTATPGVVNINTSKVVRRQMDNPFNDWLGDLMGPFGSERGRGEQRQTQTNLGSGFVIDTAGFVLTNRHVVDGADEISVSMPDGKRYEAKLIGRDARTDVALLKIEPKGTLTVLTLGDSDRTDVGEWVMAIGNPFGLGGNSVTVGVVSYKGRPLNLGTQGTAVDMIQTDASINPGNSGGPLLNTRGEVIGINTMIITRGLPQSAGVGFAVPINVAKEILPQLREKGKVVRGWLGVQIQPVDEDLARSLKLKEPKGAMVNDVTAGSPAEKAGIKPDDVIVAADATTIETSSDLSRYIASKAPGVVVKLSVVRDGSARPVSVELGTFPEDDQADEARDSGRVRLGMTLSDLTPAIARQLELPRGVRGAVVTSVEAGEAAERANLQRGDVIVSVNGVAIEGVDDFERQVDQARSEGIARLRVRRGSGHVSVILKLS
jgi:serine protease Do